jgi:hypothetical protein
MICHWIGSESHTGEWRQDVGWVGGTLNEALGQLGHISGVYVAAGGYGSKAKLFG